MQTRLEILTERRDVFFRGVQNAKTDSWRARMKAHYWSVCRQIKALRLNIPYGQLEWEDNGDLHPNDKG